MPVTAKLSLRFYEKFGDDVANELVNWLNEVDATYRSELKELNESNFARFDSRLGQRGAELEAKIDRRAAELDAKIDRRASELDARIDKRTAELDAKIEKRTAELDQRLSELRGEMKAGFAELRQQMAGMQAELIKWTFLFWVGTIGLVLLMLRFPGPVR